MSHAGSPVAKEDLFASVWSGTAVSDDALTSCVQELRRALEDDPLAASLHRNTASSPVQIRRAAVSGDS